MSEALALRHGMERNTRPQAREEALEPSAVRAQLDRILASKSEMMLNLVDRLAQPTTAVEEVKPILQRLKQSLLHHH